MQAVNLDSIQNGYLSPKMFEVSKRLFLREALGEEFCKENNISLTFEGGMNVKNELFERVLEDELSRSHKFLYMFPIFEKMYRVDGSKKDIYELFDEMTLNLEKIIHKYLVFDIEVKVTALSKEEYRDCQEFYYELILPHIYFATEQDYIKLAKKYGVSSLQSLLIGMEKYFNGKAQEKLNFIAKSFGEDSCSFEEVKNELKKDINAIIRFRNGAILNPIAEKLLREGGFVRGTKEILPCEIEKRRNMFANSLIGVYDAIENEDEYKQRAENEKMDIDEVINALYYNRFENFLNNVEINEQEVYELGKAEVVRTAQILKIARILSFETNKNYFGEFLKIPDVNRLMILFEKDKNGYLGECMKKAQIRFKKVVYPKTEAEEGKYREYILGIKDVEPDIKNKIMMLKDEIR